MEAKEDEAHGIAVIQDEPGELAVLNRGEVDVQIETAHRYPRSIDRFKKLALTIATADHETAASCFYALPRAGTTIEGPGVRLAEIVASCWGNLRAGSEVIDIGDTHVTVRGFAHDLETNFAVSLQIRRKITNKYGKRYSDDMITMTANAASSIAFRNAIFKVVPKAFVQQVYNEAKKVAIGDAKTLSARRKDMFGYFQKMGVTEDRVLAMLQREGTDDVDLKDMEKLVGFATAIKEGDISADETFPELAKDDEKTKTTALADKVKAKAKKTQEAEPQKEVEEVPDTQFGKEENNE
jgi:hypothetical protein